MLLQDVVVYQRNRIRNPWVWVPVVGLGVLIFLGFLPFLLQDRAQASLGAVLSTILGAFGVSALYLWLSPAPWLWTGGRASHAPFLRGVAQAALFNMAFILGIGAFQMLLSMDVPRKPSIAIILGTLVSGLLIHGSGAAVAGYFITLWERTKLVKEETEKKLREAHWVLLRGQLSPHVLFNALNGLAELVRVDALKAEQVILDLSDLYRALLDHGSRQWTPLREERRLVTRYLAVEQMRLGDRLKVSWQWDEALEHLEGPPFLVQPLVENALKHGINPCPEGGEVGIGLARVGTDAVLWVSNSGRPMPLVLGNGVGVGNLEARLYLAFGDQARFKLRTTEDGETVAEVVIALAALRRNP